MAARGRIVRGVPGNVSRFCLGQRCSERKIVSGCFVLGGRTERPTAGVVPIDDEILILLVASLSQG